jgi:hypothetical protein
MSPSCTLVQRKLWTLDRGDRRKSTRPRRSEQRKGSPRKRLSDRPRGRNGFDPKWPGMNPIAEMGRWMGGNARRAERLTPFEKPRNVGSLSFWKKLVNVSSVPEFRVSSGVPGGLTPKEPFAQQQNEQEIDHQCDNPVWPRDDSSEHNEHEQTTQRCLNVYCEHNDPDFATPSSNG